MGFESPPIEEKPVTPEEKRPLEPAHYPERENPKAEDFKYLIGLEQARIKDIDKEQKRKGTVDPGAMEAIRGSQRKIKGYEEKIKALEG